MNVSHHVHKDHGIPDHGINEEPKRSYWKRAHHDWKFWIMLFLMIVAIMFYVLSDNFALLYRARVNV